LIQIWCSTAIGLELISGIRFEYIPIR